MTSLFLLLFLMLSGPFIGAEPAANTVVFYQLMAAVLFDAVCLATRSRP